MNLYSLTMELSLLHNDSLLDPKSIEFNLRNFASNGPFFQGLLLENSPKEIADKMHAGQGANPYSQFVYSQGDKYYWKINFLNEKLANPLIAILNSPQFSKITVKARNLAFYISEKTLRIENLAQTHQQMFSNEPHERYSLRFITPTAFKTQGRYEFFPSEKLILQSIATKYSQTIDAEKEVDEQLLSDLVKSARITKYNLGSRYFRTDGVSIPGFTGTLTLSIRGPETLRAYVGVLMSFANFSGVGIKTSLGMGAVQIRPSEKRGSTGSLKNNE